jgi:prepilin-type N-terminal cleavage/methylation domain-containing protein
MKVRKKLNQKGFTLIEMAVVMTVIAILAALAGYSYYTQIQQMRLSGDVRQVDQTLQQAKMQAVSSGVPCGVVFWRKGGDDRTKEPGEFWIFMDTTGDNRYTDPGNDLPCTGCKPNPLDASSISSDDYTPIHCPKAGNPNCVDDPTVTTDYIDTNDVILDGPFVLERGDYFTRIFGSNDAITGGVTEFSSPPTGAGYEYILFDPLGGVRSPRTPLVQANRRIHIQNHPRQNAEAQADQGAIELIFATGVTRVVPRGPVDKDAWGPP